MPKKKPRSSKSSSSISNGFESFWDTNELLEGAAKLELKSKNGHPITMRLMTTAHPIQIEGTMLVAKDRTPSHFYFRGKDDSWSFGMTRPGISGERPLFWKAVSICGGRQRGGWRHHGEHEDADEMDPDVALVIVLECLNKHAPRTRRRRKKHEKANPD